jgi:hypothetical protein
MVKGEVTLTLSPLKTTHTYTDLVAYAKRIQNLILMEPGTIPGCSNMGVGIRRFLYDLADAVTLSDIEMTIRRQLMEYDKENYIRKIIIEYFDSPLDGSKGVLVRFICNFEGILSEDVMFAINFNLLNQGTTKVNLNNTILGMVSDIYV